MHDGVQLLPRLTSISGSVDRSLLGLDEDDLIGITAPHDVKQWTVDLKYLEADFVRIHCPYYIKHISFTTVCKQADSCQRDEAPAKPCKSFLLMIVSLIFDLRRSSPAKQPKIEHALISLST